MTGEELRTIRVQQGIEQVDMAYLLGYGRHKNTIWRKEQGRNKITRQDIIIMKLRGFIGKNDPRYSEAEMP